MRACVILLEIVPVRNLEPLGLEGTLVNQRAKQLKRKDLRPRCSHKRDHRTVVRGGPRAVGSLRAS